MTARTGHYESGAFDLRCDPPRLTAVGRAVQALARTGTYAHPLVEVAGWWRAGASGAAALPHLALMETGRPEDAERLAACCRARGIALARGPRRAATPLGEIGAIRGEIGGLAFVYAPRGAARDGLRVEVPAGADFACAADAFLDLAIDDETGVVRLEGLGPDNQYTARRLPMNDMDEDAAPDSRARALAYRSR